MSFVAKLMKSGTVPIYLVTFADVNGNDVHFYVKSTQIKMDAFLKESNQKDLSDYGEILVSGFGKQPTAETKRLMKEKYDFDA